MCVTVYACHPEKKEVQKHSQYTKDSHSLICHREQQKSTFIHPEKLNRKLFLEIITSLAVLAVRGGTYTVIILMLLRNRSRAVTKPGLMADHSTSSQQPTNHQNYYARTTPSIFGSPKFRDFTNKCLSSLTGTTDSSSLRSPTSILDTTKALVVVSPFAFGNPFSSSHHISKSTQKFSSENNNTISSLDSKCIGLALVGNLKDEAFFQNCSDNNNNDNNNNNQPNKGNVLFGTQLRVKIPPLPPPSTFSPQTCVGGDDPQNPGIYTKVSDSSTAADVLSLSEMELSEEYTRVISHGPNPRTTHIFNNCIVESYFSLPNKKQSHSSSSGNNFLSFCYTCKKHLDQTKDIFIYRGEKAFCSPECRQREMVLDGVENSEF